MSSENHSLTHFKHLATAQISTWFHQNYARYYQMIYESKTLTENSLRRTVCLQQSLICNFLCEKLVSHKSLGTESHPKTHDNSHNYTKNGRYVCAKLVIHKLDVLLHTIVSYLRQTI